MAKIQGKQLVSPIILSGSFSGSFEGDGSNLTGIPGGNTETGSFATTGSNVFIGDQIITGSVTITGSLEVVGNITGSIESASYAISSSLAEEASNNFDTISYNNTTFGITAIRTNGGQQTAFITNVPSSSFADTASFAGNLFGTPSIIVSNITASIISASGNIITNTLTASGLNYPSADGTDGQVIITDGAGNLSFGHGEKLQLQVRNDDSVDITAGTPIYSTGEIGGSERIKVRIASASDASKMPAIGIVETTLTTTGATQDGFAIINGIYNTNITPVSGTPALGDNVYVHADGGVTTIKPSGSNLIQNIGTVLKTNGTVIQGMKVSSIDRTNDVPNLLDNTIFFGSGSDQTQQIHISGALDQTIINNITASGNISASGNFIGNEITGSKLAITNGSFLAQPSGYSGLSSIINGGAFFQIVEEAEKVFGIYSLAAGIDILRIDNDPLRFTIDPDNEGFNFGIRTSTPPEALTVNGNISASGNIRIDGNNGLQLDANNSRIYYDSTAINISPNDSDILAVGENIIRAEAPITASIISASGQIIGDVIDTSFENFLNFEAATAYTYIAPFPMTINFTGSSTSSMDVAGFVTASANSSSFSPQQGLPLTLNIFDKLKITPSSSGLFTFSGSRII